MLNTITILGRLARDPELRYTQSRTAVASFTVAVDRDFTDGSGQRGVDFIDCVAWRQGGEFVSKYFRKGDSICVTGRLQSRGWTDRDGNKRTAWEIVTDHTYFAGSRRDGRAQGQTDSDAYAGAARPVNVDGPEYEELGYGPGDGSPYAAQGQQMELDDSDGDLPF